VHRKGDKGLVLKLDYEKAYDKVNLEFLYEVLELRGFNPTFIRFIKQITQEVSVGVKVNDIEADFFLTGKGLRQGVPLPLSCLIVLLMFFLEY
jgi:mannosylglycoprotein endo-beta-mannosidase